MKIKVSPCLIIFFNFIAFLCDNFLKSVVFYCIFLAYKLVVVKRIEKFGQKMSKRFGSVFLHPTEPNNTESKLRYSVNLVRSSTEHCTLLGNKIYFWNFESCLTLWIVSCVSLFTLFLEGWFFFRARLLQQYKHTV